MNAAVFVVGKHEFTRKDGKTAYVVELVDIERKVVYKAFTSLKHYNKLSESNIDNFEYLIYNGFVSFENGFTKFYLPKEEVNSNGTTK